MVGKARIFELAKGFRGRGKNCIRIARQRVEKALQYQFKDRKRKKREFRSLWIQRINAGAKEHGVSYSHLIHGLQQQNINLNRKVLSELAINEPLSFKALVEQVRFMRGEPNAAQPQA